MTFCPGGVGALVLTIAVVLFITLAYWDTKVPARLDDLNWDDPETLRTGPRLR